MKTMYKLFTFLTVLASLGCLRAQQTYNLLEIIPNQSGTIGELRFIESNGWTAGTGTNYAGFKAPASIGSNFVFTLPNALPATVTRCLQVTTAGVIEYAAAACGTGGSPPFVDTTSIVEGNLDNTKELRFEVDGFTTATVRTLTPQNANYTIAGTNIGQTFTGTNTFIADQTFSSNILVGNHILPQFSLQSDLGSITLRFDDIYTAKVDISSTITTGGATRVQGDLIPIDSTRWLGTSANRWNTVWAATINASSTSTFSGTINGTSISLSGAIGTGASSGSFIDIGPTGNFFTRDTGAASTGISCSGVNDGWLAITSDNFIVVCDGGARFRVAFASF